MTPEPLPVGDASPAAAATATMLPAPTAEPSPRATPSVTEPYALVAQWGSPVALPMPSDVAALPGGRIVVGGLTNGSVAIFDADGELRARWRVEASTRAIAASSEGVIYAWAEGGLLALDDEGNTLSTTAISGMPPGQPPPLVDLAVAPDGTVYLAAGLGPGIDSSASILNGLVALSPSGDELGRWELPDPLRVRQLAALPDGTVAVVLAAAESAGAARDADRLLRLDPATFAGDWESGAAMLDGIRRIDGLAALPDGRLAVFAVGDQESGNPAKTVLAYLATDGSEAGRWTIPNHGGKYVIDSIGMAALPDGTLLVNDGANHRVMRVGANGEVSGEVGGIRPGDFGTPEGIAIGPHGDIWVVDGLLNRVTAFAPDGSVTGQFGLPWRYATPGEPHDVAVGADSRVYVSRGIPGEIVVLSDEGKIVAGWSQPARTIPGGISVFAPGDIAIDDDDVLYIAMYPDPQLDLYTPDGELLGPWPFASEPLQVLDVATRGTSAWALVSNGGFRIERLDGLSDDAAEVVVELPKTGDRPDIVPTSIALDADGNIYLADPFARLIVKLDAQGQEITRWELGTEQPRVVGASIQVAVGDDGRVYVADSGTGQILVNAPD